MINPCDLISGQISGFFSCSAEPERIRIRTPFLYPDGDVIDLYVVVKDGGTFSITDYGETIRWLKGQTLARKKTVKQKQLMQDICMTLGIELFRGMLVVRVGAVADLSDAMLRLSQCCVRVADISLTMRAKLVESFSDEVAELLDENKIRYVRNEKIAGRSGHPYVIDFHIRQLERSTLLNVLSTGNKAVARSAAERATAAWFDLDHLKVTAGLQFVSLFDDTSDAWTEEEFRLVGRLSDIELWSAPDALIRKVA